MHADIEALSRKKASTKVRRTPAANPHTRHTQVHVFVSAQHISMQNLCTAKLHLPNMIEPHYHGPPSRHASQTKRNTTLTENKRTANSERRTANGFLLCEPALLFHC
jgi:hypothetical protein